MRTAIKCPVHPTDEQKRQLTAEFGQVRFVWNHMLALRLRFHRMFGKWVSPLTLKKRLAVMKRRPRWAWLSQADSIALQETLRNLDKALTRAFETGAGFPKFKRRSGKQSSFHCTSLRLLGSPSENLPGNASLRVPKLGEMRVNLHREIPDGFRLTSVTISLSKAGRYYASLAFDDGRSAPAPPRVLRAEQVGAGDLGVSVLMTLHTGEEIPNPRHERRNDRKIRSLQRELSRKKKGSNNWDKARVLLARAHEKQADARADHAHKISRRLIRENQAFGLEDLDLRGMVKGGRGLARSLQGAGLGMIGRFCRYKAEREGRILHEVDRFFPSSKRCNPCGYVNRDLKRGDRVWTCPCCGAVLLRDGNAASNIRDETIRELRAAGLVVLGA